LKFVPADGIRLTFSLEAEISERRRFLGSSDKRLLARHVGTWGAER
jgi:hypothetical protein